MKQLIILEPVEMTNKVMSDLESRDLPDVETDMGEFELVIQE